MADAAIPQVFQIDLPPAEIAGKYADFASVWHTESIFVLDFVALAQPPTTATDAVTDQQQVLIPGSIVSRIRIPPAQVFEVARALTQQLEMWEQQTGLKPPQNPLFPAEPDQQ
jgi:hypothetical protein